MSFCVLRFLFLHFRLFVSSFTFLASSMLPFMSLFLVSVPFSLRSNASLSLFFAQNKTLTYIYSIIFCVSVNIFCRFCSTFYLPFISIPIKIPQKIHPRCTPSLASAGVLFFLFLCVCVRSASPAALHCFGGVAAGHGDGPRV